MGLWKSSVSPLGKSIAQTLAKKRHFTLPTPANLALARRLRTPPEESSATERTQRRSGAEVW